MGGAGGLDMNMLPPGGPNEMQKTFVGTLMFSPKDTGTGVHLDKYGEYGRDELELLKQVIREGDIVVDAGAQYGVTSLGLAQVVGPQGAVYAFEPQRVLHQILCSNFAMNSAANCHCKQEALGQQPGEAVVPAVDVNVEGCHGCSALDSSNYLGETVKMNSVDALNLPKMRLLKVDVEGMELDVVRGAVKTINMFKPALYMKAHYNPEDNTCVPSPFCPCCFVMYPWVYSRGCTAPKCAVFFRKSPSRIWLFWENFRNSAGVLPVLGIQQSSTQHVSVCISVGNPIQISIHTLF